IRARRSVRKTRIATVSTAILTTGVIIAGAATWSAHRHESTAPANGPTIRIDPRTGTVTADETGATVVPAPAASPLSDADLRSRCQQAGNRHYRDRTTVIETTGPLTDSWKVVVKSGDRSTFAAMFLSPDRSVVVTCYVAPKQSAVGSYSTTKLYPGGRNHLPWAEEIGLRVAKPGVAHVLLDMVGETKPREARLGTDGFFTHEQLDAKGFLLQIARIRAYDAGGRMVYEQINRPQSGKEPSTAQKRTVDPTVTVKTADPVTPDAVLTKDPLTGDQLVPAPPVSSLTDDQVRTRCAQVDAIYFSGSHQPDPVIVAAGPVNKNWTVALKTGTGNKLTAVLISPDKRVYAWCHMLTPSAKGAYDYTRGAVQASGKFAETFEFGMVPDGVAQLVVDLPKQGPTRALITNGFYIWGLTGGNSDIQNVRVRGYNAHGKQIYDARKDVDADFD
ncbi:MAG: hypothetical protein HOV67_08310, partial [Kribbellaceae bacterium]|nr:hypothetical protein [Kribbellaceae bacterium]